MVDDIFTQSHLVLPPPNHKKLPATLYVALNIRRDKTSWDETSW